MGFLQVWSKDGRQHFIPWSDPTMRGAKDISVPPHKKISIDTSWENEPAFLSAVADGFIAYKEIEKFVLEKDVEVPEELKIDDLEKLKLIAHNIVEKNLDPNYIAMLEMTPRDGNDAPDNAYMKSTFTRFLKYVKYLESKMRGRKTIIDLCDERLEEIKGL